MVPVRPGRRAPAHDSAGSVGLCVPRRDMGSFAPSVYGRYGIAVVSVVVAVAARLLLDPLLGNLFPFATIFFAVLVAVGHGGFGPGLAATLLGTLASVWLLLPPRGTWAVYGIDHQAG